MNFIDPTYLRTIYDGLLSGTLQKDNASALPAGLVGIYEEFLPPASHVKERQKFLEFFSGWAVLKKEGSTSFVSQLLAWPEEQVLDYITRYSKWFNSPTSGKYALYHERLRSFILQKISHAHFTVCNDFIIKLGHEALDKRSGDEWEHYALEHLSTHLLIQAMESKDATMLKTLAYNNEHWNRQVEISKGFEWSKRMLNGMMLWAFKYDDDEVIECALNKVDLYHREQNDAPRIVELVAQNDMDTALQRIKAFGGNDEEGLQRKFILYMLCLMELTLLDSKDKPFRKEAIEKLLKHLDDNLPVDHSVLNWSNFISEYFIFVVCEKIQSINLDYSVIFNRTKGWNGDWLSSQFNDNFNISNKDFVSKILAPVNYPETENIYKILFNSKLNNDNLQELQENYFRYLLIHGKLDFAVNYPRLFDIRDELISNFIEALLVKHKIQLVEELINNNKITVTDSVYCELITYYLRINNLKKAQSCIEKVDGLYVKNKGLYLLCEYYISGNNFDEAEKILEQLTVFEFTGKSCLELASKLYELKRNDDGFMFLDRTVFPFLKQNIIHGEDVLDFDTILDRYFEILKLVYSKEKDLYNFEKVELRNLIVEKCNDESQRAKYLGKLAILFFELEEYESAFKLIDTQSKFTFGNKANPIALKENKLKAYVKCIELALLKNNIDLADSILHKISAESSYFKEASELIILFKVKNYYNNELISNLNIYEIKNPELKMILMQNMDIDKLEQCANSFLDYNEKYCDIIFNRILSSHRISKINDKHIDLLIKYLIKNNFTDELRDVIEYKIINSKTEALDLLLLIESYSVIADIIKSALKSSKWDYNLSADQLQRYYSMNKDYNGLLRLYNLGKKFKTPYFTEYTSISLGREDKLSIINHCLINNKYNDAFVLAKENNLIANYVNICIELGIIDLVEEAIQYSIGNDLYVCDLLNIFARLNRFDEIDKVLDGYFNTNLDRGEIQLCFEMLCILVKTNNEQQISSYIDLILQKISNWDIEVEGNWETVVNKCINAIETGKKLNLPYYYPKFITVGIEKIPSRNDFETLSKYIDLLNVSVKWGLTEDAVLLVEELPYFVRSTGHEYYTSDFLLRIAKAATLSGKLNLAKDLLNESVSRWQISVVNNPDYEENLHLNYIQDLYEVGLKSEAEFLCLNLKSNILRNECLTKFVHISVDEGNIEKAVEYIDTCINNFTNAESSVEIFNVKNSKDNCYEKIIKYYIYNDNIDDAEYYLDEIDGIAIKEDLCFSVAYHFVQKNNIPAALKVMKKVKSEQVVSRFWFACGEVMGFAEAENLFKALSVDMLNHNYGKSFLRGFYHWKNIDLYNNKFSKKMVKHFGDDHISLQRNLQKALLYKCFIQLDSEGKFDNQYSKYNLDQIKIVSKS